MGRSSNPLRFEDLCLYQLSEELSDQVWSMVQSWSILARDAIGKQLIRAADSIGVNIAEGSGRGIYQDNRRFVRIARGSLDETRQWLRRAFNRKLLTDTDTARIKFIIEELGPKMSTYLRSIGPKSN